MSEKWDYESRLDTTTRADKGAYDQIVALSQGLINENFQKLYDAYKNELSQLNYSGVLGKFSGKVKPPVILIPGADKHEANPKEVIMQLSFESGKLVNSDDSVLVEDLKGWVFAVPTVIVPEQLPAPSTTEKKNDTDTKKMKDAAAKKKEDAEAKRKRIAERFDHPGDYSIERLYMKLSTSRWDNLDTDLSVAGLNEKGNPVPYVDWAADEDNRDTKDLLEFWLKKWGADNEKNSLNSLGLTFKPPQQKQTQTRFVPKNLLHQTHQYQSKKNGCKDGKTGLGGAGDCNCLLYLEMVEGGGEKPQDPRVIWSGNFATQTTYGHPAVRGTFLLSHEILFDKVLLPNLTLLNRASEIYHKPATFEEKEGGYYVYMNWVVGGDPNHPSSDDAAYRFKTLLDTSNSRLVVGYEWTKSTKQDPLEDSRKLKGWTSSLWYRASSKDEAKTRVTWEAGKNEIVLSGTATSWEFCRGAWTKEGLDNQSFWMSDKYTVTWGAKFKLVADEDTNEDASHLHIDVEGSKADGSYFKVERKLDHHDWYSGGHEIALGNSLENEMKDGVDRAIAAIREKLKTTGRLTYPGGAALVFENPVVGRYGDLNAQVKYKPFKADGRIKVPDVTKEATTSTTTNSASQKLMSFRKTRSAS